VKDAFEPPESVTCRDVEPDNDLTKVSQLSTLLALTKIYAWRIFDVNLSIYPGLELVESS
jgi:hypothetical protein